MLQLIAVAFVLLTLYYARFFVAVRQDTSTLIQGCILLLAAAILAWPVSRRWRPTSAQVWAITLIALGLMAAMFAWADHDSHSASDTLNRAVPGMCLIFAVALRITVGHFHTRGAATR